jgi:hypothetical protein
MVLPGTWRQRLFRTYATTRLPLKSYLPMGGCAGNPRAGNYLRDASVCDFAEVELLGD